MSDGRIDRILQVGTSDSAGGAERVMMDLHAEYLRRDLDSWVAVGYHRSTQRNVVEIPNASARNPWARVLGAGAARVAGQHMGVRRAIARGMLFISDPVRYAPVLAGHEDMEYPGTARLLDIVPEPQVLHLHNLHGGYFDIRALPDLAARVPTLLTMHDAWLLTGHCAHPFECQGWKTGCQSCPHLDTPIRIRRDAAAENLALKRRAFGQTSTAIVSPSSWLMSMAESAGVADSSHRLARVIPNGVDTAVFVPGDRRIARERLGLPADAKIVLFAGQSLHANPYKDFGTLLKALPMVADDSSDVLLVALGSESHDAGDLPIRHVPFTTDPGRVAMYLQAADVYVHAARAENLPLVIIEAMACGTPVVASSVGGIPELIAHDETGLLVRPGDADALAEAIIRLLGDDEARARLSHAGLERVRARHSLQKEADAYLAFYAEVVADWGRRREPSARTEP